jgi:hypothetical protein
MLTPKQTGLFDSLIRFPMSNVVASLDASLGTHDWIVLRAALHLTEVADPPSPIFNRGVGAFEIRWIAVDEWTEGTCIPITPTTDGIAWQDLPFLLNSATDVSLGQFTNSGIDSALAFDLALEAPFVSHLRSGTRDSLLNCRESANWIYSGLAQLRAPECLAQPGNCGRRQSAPAN